MSQPLKKIESGKKAVWISQPNESEQLLKRRDLAFDVAKGKFKDSGGKIETLMQTAEAFGRGLFEEHLKRYLHDDEWTMNAWVEPLVGNIFNPMGTGATFTKISEDEARSIVFSCPLHEKSDHPNIASLFTYGYLRGMLLSAFPQGELLMGKSLSEGAPGIELIFKVNAEDTDRFERERIKKDFGINDE